MDPYSLLLLFVTVCSLGLLVGERKSSNARLARLALQLEESESAGNRVRAELDRARAWMEACTAADRDGSVRRAVDGLLKRAHHPAG